MKRDQLMPYVYKIDGPVNVALYDFLEGEFYQIPLKGASIKELREFLLKEKLIFETDGIVPTKIMTDDMAETQNTIQLRVMQIRVNGTGEDNCWNRAPKNSTPQFISHDVLDGLKQNCRFIPVQKIRIEAQTDDYDKIGKILNEFEYREVELYVREGIEPEMKEQYKKLCNNRGITFMENGRKVIKELKATIFNFFYSKFFNPCLGQQVAVDTNGEIKCCLWSDDVMGNIGSDNLKAMIIEGKFDLYWEMTKSNIDGCKDCELRCACSDCRVSVCGSPSMSARPSMDSTPPTSQSASRQSWRGSPPASPLSQNGSRPR